MPDSTHDAIIRAQKLSDDLTTIHPDLLELLHAAGRACDDKGSATFTHLKECLTAWRAHSRPVYPEPADDGCGFELELNDATLVVKCNRQLSAESLKALIEGASAALRGID